MPIKGQRTIGAEQIRHTNKPTKSQLASQARSMKIGNKAVGMVALVAAMVLLQLAVAPTAMARLPRVSNETIVMVTEEGVQQRRYYCMQSCQWTACTNPNCNCISNSCFMIR
uniref:Uncharacterized protein n=1 Tax=Aegilops tauschii subsp. strangulata TaxID=200361 RepID=A0A453PXG3_AEGTS